MGINVATSASGGDDTEYSLVILSNVCSSTSEGWVMNSGCSYHVTKSDSQATSL